MKKLNSMITYPLIILLVALSLNICAQTTNETKTAGGLACPSGYYPISHLNICMKDTLDPSAVHDATAAGGCLRGYEQPLGVQFCMIKGTALNIIKERYFVTGLHKGRCKPNFRPSQQLTLCIADHLSLKLKGEKLTLFAPKLNCPSGYEQRPRATSCTPIRDSKPGVLKMKETLACVPGFMKPAGEDVCMSHELVRRTSETNSFGVIPPEGACPVNLRKYQTKGFCVPRYTVVQCGSPDFPCSASRQGLELKIVEDIDGGGCCPPGVQPSVINIPDPINSFTTIPVYACGPPAGTDHVDCEQPNFLPLTN